MTRHRGDDSLALLFSLGQTALGRWIEGVLLDPGESIGKCLATGDDAVAGEVAANFARQTLDLIERGEIACQTQSATTRLGGLLFVVALLQCRAPTMRNEILAQRAIRAKPSTTEGQIDEQ